MAINPDPKLIEFARGLLELSKRTGYTVYARRSLSDYGYPGIAKLGGKGGLDEWTIVDRVVHDCGGTSDLASFPGAKEERKKEYRMVRDLLGLPMPSWET